MKFLIAFGFILLIVVLFITTYVLNNRTEKPDIDIDIEGCGGCHNINCGHHPTHLTNKEAK
ncbi:hypothetical protein LJB88_04900 [Erysipelotrichaceae bacterium OttesenSCG-928-M19]|nr:hypothetical protein [Erysipelotrichaceae bacterium OttesenSCG-928-M19]